MVIRTVVNKWKEFCKHQHDVVCSQMYDKELPYSFHLRLVFNNALEHIHLIKSRGDKEVVLFAALGHDLMEDARLTYNDIKDEVYRIITNDNSGLNPLMFTNKVATKIAEVIYAVTDEKGRNRSERKSDKFYEELSKNDLAVFVKLCDLKANMEYGALTKSSMVGKYRKELPHIEKKLYKPEFEELFKKIREI